MDDLWGELVLVKGKPTVNISKKIKKNEIEDTSRHFLLHITNLRIWEELSKDKNRKPQELKESISGSEEDIVIKVHALLANSYCECGNNNHMKFQSAAIWKVGNKNFKIRVTYKCLKCNELKQKEAEFQRSNFKAWCNRFLKR